MKPERTIDPGFIKLQRTDTTAQVFENMAASHLLAVIAFRARFTDDPNLHGLCFGEALIGDHKSYGMTRQQERTARKHLERWQLVEFRTSRAGTVARLLDSRIWSLREERKSNHQANHQFSEEKAENPTITSTDDQPTTNHHLTTNSEGKKERRTESDIYRPTELPLIDATKLDQAEQIYAAYPKKVARLAALKAIDAALRKTPFARLLSSTNQFSAAVSKWSVADRDFIPHPATWFNRGSYDDDPATWQRGVQSPVHAPTDYTKF